MVERFFAEITRKRIRRGVFKSVDELKHAIMDYLDNHNGHPKPYIWTKTGTEIFSKVARAKQVLESHNTKTLAPFLTVVYPFRDAELAAKLSPPPLSSPRLDTVC